MRKTTLAALAALPFLLPAVLAAQMPEDEPFRPPVQFTDEPPAPPLSDRTPERGRIPRNYPEQPPVIPHAIAGYEINLRTNRCLTCHSRKYYTDVDAPMISITHYVDRAGQTLGAVAPRRYFCTQCHVPQADVDPPVANRYVELESLVEHGRDAGAGRR
ncbi:nitrate reductase cytochrome c-type subunit [Azospirillum sp. ST 5-10]|uniref:nitrate reductase cytochrome c-type subunit n=1 Tax=unclassified Azospirillum TaxID=2630922 RepID=UPI003F4A7637